MQFGKLSMSSAFVICGNVPQMTVETGTSFLAYSITRSALIRFWPLAMQNDSLETTFLAISNSERTVTGKAQEAGIRTRCAPKVQYLPYFAHSGHSRVTCSR